MKLRKCAVGLILVYSLLSLCGCTQEQEPENIETREAETAGEAETNASGTDGNNLPSESAEDRKIDFEALQKQNPDIFAWLYIPGTGIDVPVLQSGIRDDFYEDHTLDGSESDAGAPYTEMANLMNMCDFNTIIHGKDRSDTDFFAGLHSFENPEFFAEHELFYIYLPDNVLTYAVVAAYYDEPSDILRRYDYTTWQGCEDFLNQMYDSREMGKNLRTDLEALTPCHYLVTLNGDTDETMQRQYVVIGVLVGDAAGTIDRIILD